MQKKARRHQKSKISRLDYKNSALFYVYKSRIFNYLVGNRKLMISCQGFIDQRILRALNAHSLDLGISRND